VKDVVVDGMSLVLNYRAQFGRILAAHPYAGLVARMQAQAPSEPPPAAPLAAQPAPSTPPPGQRPTSACGRPRCPADPPVKPGGNARHDGAADPNGRAAARSAASVSREPSEPCTGRH
jgi:hypothetical protein